MKAILWKSRILPLLPLVVAVGLLASPAWAELSGSTGYGVYETTLENVDDSRSYSGGLDVVYAQVASGSAAGKTRCFVRCEDGDWDGSGTFGIQVNMYNYTSADSNHVLTLADAGNPYGSGMYTVYSQGLKVDPTPDGSGNRVVWFSMTGNASNAGDWYTVTVDPDFSAAGTPVHQFTQPGCWEVEWNPATGQAFYAGKESDAWSDPHAIFIYTGGALQEVVRVEGYSCGFAFDPNGNLYAGTYTSIGPADQQYVLMFNAAQVANAISSGATLTATSGTSIALPSPNAVFLGANDLECDEDGNIYITANGAWDDTYDSDVGYVYRIDAWSGTTPTSMSLIASGTFTDDSDWQKALAFDGSSNLAAGGYYDPTNSSQIGNRLYVDQDYGFGSGGPDVVSGLAVDTDTDNDGVPDALDNAYLTSNSNQWDTDGDMYGNMVDGDFNNSGSVNYADKAVFGLAFSGTYNEDCDFDGNGSITYLDKAKFGVKFNTSAPWF